MSINSKNINYPIKSITINERDYPEMLRYINDPPKKLYYRGDISIASKLCVSVVGSRNSTQYGKWASKMIGSKLTDYQIPVVSGMALGIDSYCHEAALENQGETIAVLGSGVDVCYPKSNFNLMERILVKGLLISEYPPGFKPTKYSFPARNRIISGISKATVIIEAGIASGSLITAEYAAEQGRNLYAVPGNINSIYSMGTNKLIREGVLPLTVFDELIEDLGIKRKEVESIKKTLGKDEIIIFDALEIMGESTIDKICIKTGKSASQVSGIITLLEMKGIVLSYMGKIFIAK